MIRLSIGSKIARAKPLCNLGSWILDPGPNDSDDSVSLLLIRHLYCHDSYNIWSFMKYASHYIPQNTFWIRLNTECCGLAVHLIFWAVVVLWIVVILCSIDTIDIARSLRKHNTGNAVRGNISTVPCSLCVWLFIQLSLLRFIPSLLFYYLEFWPGTAKDLTTSRSSFSSALACFPSSRIVQLEKLNFTLIDLLLPFWHVQQCWWNLVGLITSWIVWRIDRIHLLGTHMTYVLLRCD